MSRSKLLALLGSGAMLFGALAMGGCPQTGGTTDGEVAEESSDSTAAPGESVDAADASSLDTVPPLENPPDITDAGKNESGVVGDFDGDLALTEADIQILARSFDSTLPGGDLNSDNVVNIMDLALLLSLVR